MGEVAEWVVGAGGSRDAGGGLGGGPLLPASGGELLLLPDQLVGPPLASGLRSRDKSGNISRGERDGSLPLADMMGKLALMGNLGSPPLGSSRGSRDESRDVARGDWEGGLPLAHVVGELAPH